MTFDEVEEVNGGLGLICKAAQAAKKAKQLADDAVNAVKDYAKSRDAKTAALQTTAPALMSGNQQSTSSGGSFGGGGFQNGADRGNGTEAF